jgi:hypothetical protein
MSTFLAILAHQSAQPTIDDFLPRWKALGARMGVFVPREHNVDGFQLIYHQGENAYSGQKVFERFLLCCESLVMMSYDSYIIAEYDTVNLRDELPEILPEKISSSLMWSNGPEGHEHELQLCALSPWCMTKPTLVRFIAAAREHIDGDGDMPSCKGLLDRWIGSVMVRANIGGHTPHDMIGYPWHPGIERRIKNIRANFVHGFKSRKEFGDAWTHNG